MKNFFALGRMTAPKEGDDYNLDTYFLAMITVTLCAVVALLGASMHSTTSGEKLVHTCSAIEFGLVFLLMAVIEYSDNSYTAPLILLYITDATQIVFLILGQKFSSYIAEASISFCFIFKHLFTLLAVLTAANASFEREEGPDQDIIMWTWSIYWFNTYFGCYGFLSLLMQNLDIPVNVLEGIATFSTGLWLAPMAMGHLGIMYFLTWYVIYYYARGYILPWKRYDFFGGGIYNSSSLVGFGVSSLAIESPELAARLRVVLENTPSLTHSAGVDEILDVFFSLIDYEDKNKISAKQFREFWATFGMKWGSDPKIFTSQKRIKRDQFLSDLTAQERVMIAYAFDSLMHRLRQGGLIHIISENSFEPSLSPQYLEAAFIPPVAVNAEMQTVEMQRIDVPDGSQRGSTAEPSDYQPQANRLNVDKFIRSVGGVSVENSYSDFDEYAKRIYRGSSVDRVSVEKRLRASAERSPESMDKRDPSIQAEHASPVRSPATDSGTGGFRSSLESGTERSRAVEYGYRSKNRSLEISRKARSSLASNADDVSVGGVDIHESVSPYVQREERTSRKKRRLQKQHRNQN